MTYKLNPNIAVITSLVKLIFPAGQIQKFENGRAATEAVFDQNYRPIEIRAVIVWLKFNSKL